MGRSAILSRLGLALVAVAGMMNIVACGDDDDDTSTPGSTTTATSGDVKQGGEVIIQHRPYGSFDPHFTAFGRDISQQGMVFRGLYRLDKEDTLQPELAASMPEISDDGKTYTIKMKPGLKWSDGDPLTAEDAVAGFQRTCNPDVAGQYSGNLFNIVGCQEYRTADPGLSDAEKDALLKNLGVTATDETTVEIKLKQPQASFAIQLALWFSWPSPSHIVTSPGAEWPADPTKLAFSGPFKVESFREKDNMVLVRNENYGGEHLAYLDKITLRYIENLETANNAFRNDELLATRANPAALDVLRADPELSKLLSAAETSPNTIGLTLYAGGPPLDNPKLRLALSQATDRETLNRIVLKDANIPTTSWIPEDLLGIEKNPFQDDIGYDPDKAKKSFEESGASKDVKIKLTILDSPADKDTAAFLKEQWNKILGINIDVEVLDSPGLQKSYEEETYNIVIQGWTHDYADPENWIDGLFNSDGPNNHYGCNNPKIDDLLAKAKVNQNAEERREQFIEINRLVSQEICGMAPIYHQRIFYLTADKLKGPREFSTSQDRYLAGDWAVEEWYLDD